jgi:hypothetical protein
MTRAKKPFLVRHDFFYRAEISRRNQPTWKVEAANKGKK